MKLPAGSPLPSWLQTLNIVVRPLQFLDACAATYGDTFTLRVLGIGSPPVVFFSDPASVQAIFTELANHFEFGKVTHVFRPLVGDRSLILQQGQRHQRQRQLLMPALHGEQLKRYGDAIARVTQTAIAPWQAGEQIAVRHWMSGISLEVILQVVFGLRPGEQYGQLRDLLDALLESVTAPWYSIQFFFPPLQQDLGAWSPWGRFRRHMQQIDRLVYGEIARRRRDANGGNPDGDRDVLALLMAATDATGAPMDDGELRDQLMTLLLLGHETTASSLTWVLYWIHRDRRVLETLYQELDAFEGVPADLARLPYLSAVCQEALRVYPIALISQPRRVKDTIHLEGYELDPGTIVVPCIYTTHRRSQTYTNPEKFLPERFLESKFSPYEYFPFGGGSRSCIGAALSMFEMKIALATILRQVRLSLSPERNIYPVRRGITFVPSGNFQLTVTAKSQ